MNKILERLELDAGEPFAGHKGCGGCGGTVALRLALKALGPRVFVGIPAGCMSAISFLYPQMALGVNAMISTFAGTASLISGMRAAADRRGFGDAHVLGFAGDGGTADIGLQALSGAIDRKERVIYICYDNEAYMNTGVQKSGLTPFTANTTTSPARTGTGNAVSGHKKDMFDIVVAHRIAYAATASVGFPQDYIRKVQKAARTEGTSYIQVLAPCPTGWGCESDSLGELARLAVDTGIWPLQEYDQGRFSLQRNPATFKPVREYVSAQARFRHLGEDELAQIEAERDARWSNLRRRIES